MSYTVKVTGLKLEPMAVAMCVADGIKPYARGGWNSQMNWQTYSPRVRNLARVLGASLIEMPDQRRWTRYGMHRNRGSDGKFVKQR